MLIDDVKNTCVERVLVTPATVKFVRPEPSPICLPKTVPVEMVEKKPKLVDNEFVEILLALIKFVLIVFTDNPARVVVPPVCVILLATVRALPKSSVPTNRFVIYAVLAPKLIVLMLPAAKLTVLMLIELREPTFRPNVSTLGLNVGSLSSIDSANVN